MGNKIGKEENGQPKRDPLRPIQLHGIQQNYPYESSGTNDQNKSFQPNRHS
jgi:hypothetical protein